LIPLAWVLSSAGVLLGGAVSARWNWWRRLRPGIPILMYHKIGNPPPQFENGETLGVGFSVSKTDVLSFRGGISSSHL